jgi:hypothetical protein
MPGDSSKSRSAPVSRVARHTTNHGGRRLKLSTCRTPRNRVRRLKTFPKRGRYESK